MSWNGWSAQTLMLSYLEQTAIYNAAQFHARPDERPRRATTPRRSTPRSTPSSAPPTVTPAQLASPESADQQLLRQHRHDHPGERRTDDSRQYMAPQRLDDPAVQRRPGSTGLFYYAHRLRHPVGHRRHLEHRRLQPRASRATTARTAQNCTSGVNIGGGSSLLRRVAVDHDAAGRSARGGHGRDPQSCNTACPRRPPGNGLSTNKGQLWAWGADAMSMFNTIVPPSSTQYPWGAAGSAAMPAASNRRITRTSPTPAATTRAGPTSLMADGHVQFIKSSISHADLVVARHPGQGRGDQLGCVLIPA